MRFGETELLQDLGVLAAQEEGEQLIVSLYGGRKSSCGAVRFTIPDATERQQMLALLHEWIRIDEPVSLLDRGNEMSLFSERPVLRRATEQV